MIRKEVIRWRDKRPWISITQFCKECGIGRSFFYEDPWAKIQPAKEIAIREFMRKNGTNK
jgi:hypothetical protein